MNDVDKDLVDILSYAEDAKEARDAASEILNWFEKALPAIFQNSQND